MCSTPLLTGSVDLDALLAATPGLAVLTALDGVDPFALSEPDRLVLLEVWEKQQAWLAARGLPALVAVVGSAPVDSDDFAREDVRAALHLSRGVAQDRIDVARALHTTLAATQTALAEGRIGYQQVRVLVDTLHGTDPGIARSVEATVLDRAADLTPGELRKLASRALLVADPRTAEEDHARAVEGREVITFPGGCGMATVQAHLSAEGARTVMLALDGLARKNPDKGLGIDACRADALVRLCDAALANLDLPLQHGRPTAVQIVIDLPTLLGMADNPGELVGYGPIPTSVARAMAADGIWQRLVVEPVTGHLLDAGTCRYRPNQELKDFVLTRSRTCGFPTCHTPAQACDIDHTEPFNHDGVGGGRTSAHNCRPECRRHHLLKTLGGWTVEAHPDGSCTWINKVGRRFHSPATDHRPGSP